MTDSMCVKVYQRLVNTDKSENLTRITGQSVWLDPVINN